MVTLKRIHARMRASTFSMLDMFHMRVYVIDNMIGYDTISRMPATIQYHQKSVPDDPYATRPHRGIGAGSGALKARTNHKKTTNKLFSPL